jgi:hypothetical protein
LSHRADGAMALRRERALFLVDGAMSIASD